MKCHLILLVVIFIIILIITITTSDSNLELKNPIYLLRYNFLLTKYEKYDKYIKCPKRPNKKSFVYVVDDFEINSRFLYKFYDINYNYYLVDPTVKEVKDRDIVVVRLKKNRRNYLCRYVNKEYYIVGNETTLFMNSEVILIGIIIFNNNKQFKL